MVEFQRTFVKENPAGASLLLIPSIAGSKFNFFEADSLLSGLSSVIQNSSTAKLVKDISIRKRKPPLVPLLLLNFALSDTSGKAIPLSLKGKYVCLISGLPGAPAIRKPECC